MKYWIIVLLLGLLSCFSCSAGGIDDTTDNNDSGTNDSYYGSARFDNSKFK